MVTHAQNMNVACVEDIWDAVDYQEVSAFGRKRGFSSVDWGQMTTLHEKLHSLFWMHVVDTWNGTYNVVEASAVVH